MFADRCLNLAGCGHSTNWTCPCTCGEEYARDEPTRAAPVIVKPTEIDRLKAKIEQMALYVQHDTGCSANDLDYLDDTPCTCGLRALVNPKGARS